MTTTAAPPPQTRPSTFAEAEVILAANLPGYEGRAEQQHLAHRIETDFFGHDHGTKDDPEPRAMFAQAPTGTGKSLAYLIPAVCSGKRVVVSVTTKALQDQLSGVDLPFLAEHFTFSWAVLKGRSSYLCVNRLLDAADGEIVRKTDLLKWVETVEDFSGYRDDLPFPVTDFEWTAMCSDSDYCSVKGCSYTECYAARARSRALGASIVVVNHALYFTDLAIGVQTAGAVTMVGDHEWVIFDEGHECFPAGTLVDGRPIESIRVGDLVTSFDDDGNTRKSRVTGVMANPSTELLIRVTCGGREVVATPSHPFLTQDGWVEAAALHPGYHVLHAPSTARSGSVHDVPYGLPGDRLAEEEAAPRLRGGLLLTGVSAGVSVSEYGRHEGEQGCLRERGVRTPDARAESHVRSGDAGEDVQDLARVGAPTPGTGREWLGNDRAAAPAPVGVGRGMAARTVAGDWQGSQGQGPAEPVHLGHRSPGPEDRSGGRREVTSVSGEEGVGFPEGRLVALGRVDSVQVLERGRDAEYDRVCPDGLVYNLTVEADHTYFANGVAVHNCHEVASNSLSDRLTERGFTNLTSKAVSLAHRSGASDEQARSHAGALDRAVKAFFDGLPVDRRGDSLRLTVGHLEASFESVTAVMDAIDALGVFMKSVLPGDDDGRGAKIKIMRTLRRYRERMIQFVSDEMTETVRWTVMETRNRQQVKVLEMAPVDISGYLNENLWSKTRGMVVSATLSVGGKFEFQADQLGVEHYVGTLTDSPFDFVRQGRLYVPAHLPPPQRKEQWEAATLDEIRALVRATGGRTLVLFPSVAHMRSTFRAIGDMLGVDVRMQGDGMPNRDLGRWFLDNETSVLFGTKSFMTGFDARGKTCISVIIAKLPFPVPSEPLVQARCEKIVAEGGSDFFDYSIPVMTTLLQQAVGRAHRHTTDWAMVSILDSRLVGKGYGRRVLGDMPNMPVITKRADAEAFAAQIVDHYEYV